MGFSLVTRSHAMRVLIEHRIREIYRAHYGAAVRSFPDVLLAMTDGAGRPVCAAGIRLGEQPLFLECYLDARAELILGSRIGRAVDRDEIVEICHLAAMQPGGVNLLLSRVIALARLFDVKWAVFTATAPLRTLLQRSGLWLVDLGPAPRARVPHPDDWGSYYEHDPRVTAACGETSLGNAPLLVGHAFSGPLHPHA